jgi:hypothetical protein
MDIDALVRRYVEYLAGPGALKASTISNKYR